MLVSYKCLKVCDAVATIFYSYQFLSQQQGFKVIFTMIPDVHQMAPYPFSFAHEELRQIAARLGWVFLDFTQALSVVPAPDLWAMPGDPHVNAKGHALMAKALLPLLES